MDVAGLPHPPPIDDIHEAMRRVTEAVRELPAPSMFQLAAEGFSTPFEQLIACIISVRTMEETSLPVSRRLFGTARTPEQIAALSIPEIADLITPSTFPEPKAANIHAIATRVRDEFGGELPCDGEVMQSFNGVGPKCANLALGIACLRRGLPYRAVRRAGKASNRAATDGPGEPQGGRVIPVDIHVHRVTNRWGIVKTRTPEQTTIALESVLPPEYDVEINRLLVPFGKYVCKGGAPRCPSCVLLDICPKIGVTRVRL